MIQTTLYAFNIFFREHKETGNAKRSIPTLFKNKFEPINRNQSNPFELYLRITSKFVNLKFGQNCIEGGIKITRLCVNVEFEVL